MLPAAVADQSQMLFLRAELLHLCTWLLLLTTCWLHSRHLLHSDSRSWSACMSAWLHALGAVQSCQHTYALLCTDRWHLPQLKRRCEAELPEEVRVPSQRGGLESRCAATRPWGRAWIAARIRATESSEDDLPKFCLKRRGREAALRWTVA